MAIVWVDLLLLRITQVLKHFDQHVSMLFHVCLISVPDKLHVHFAIACLLPLIVGFLLVEMVKVFVRYFRLNARLVWGSSLPQIVPVKSFEEGVLLYLICPVATKACFRVSDHLE